jgi:mono/diheme cytochrome c family protein
MGPSWRQFVSLGYLAIGLVALTGPAAADKSLVEQGAYLARAGDCEACHTAPGGRPYAGGAPINSPFGKIYPPNITSDKEAGIGGWSDDDFYRAMHEGVNKDKEYLYPAFPYQWFTKMTRQDVLALKAYLDTVPPVSIASKPTHLMFPFDVRSGLGIWNQAFFKPGEFKPDPAKSAQWNRGAYLVEGPGHCGDCHTPKNAAMAPENSQAFAGGNIDYWYAPNITSDPTRGIGKWSQDDVVKYLKTGMSPDKGVVVGPMAQVVNESMKYLSDEDIQAIAAYIKDLPPLADYKPDRPSEMSGAHRPGEEVYLNNCASCHQLNGQGRPGAIPALAGNSLVTAKGPENVVRVILQGRLAAGTYAPMPAVGNDLSDQEIADVTDYVRTAWSNAAPVIEQTSLVGSIRGQTVTGLAGIGAREVNGDPCEVEPQYHVVTISDPQHLLDQSLASMTDENMEETIPSLISRVHQISPNLAQADVVNGLSLAYCRLQSRDPGFNQPKGRARLDRFNYLVYGELTAGGHG